ncbi:oligosaccharide flippase family protein [Patescibacteria group bacterium]|nr:oligosaccharide flippase family protein [Patescibacteria group bacterium]
MASLGKWQIVSFLSRGIAMAMGIIQSFVIIRILSVEEWGMIQLAVSIGSSLGIYQHLGLASASTREISAANKETDIFKIFVTTATVRYLVTIPLSLGLFFWASRIAEIYHTPQIVLPLKVYAIALLFQGIQSILNSVVAGTQKFKELFIYQAGIAVVSVLVYLPFVYYYRVNGFFYAFFIFTAISAVSLCVIAFKPIYKNLKMPSRSEFTAILKSLFSLGMAIYVVKVIVVNWEKLGTNLLGLTANAQVLAIYAFAVLYAKKLLHVSDAVTDVNLPVFSERYASDLENFKHTFMRNFNKIFSIILFFAMSSIFWSYEVVTILVGDEKYTDSLPLILPMVFAFTFYSLADIVKSSVVVPAKLSKEMIISFVLLLFTTVVSFILLKGSLGDTKSMSFAMLLGAIVSFVYMVRLSQSRLKFKFFGMAHIIILLQTFAISMACLNAIFIFKLLGYIVLVLFYFVAVNAAGFFTKTEVLALVSKLKFKKGAV